VSDETKNPEAEPQEEDVEAHSPLDDAPRDRADEGDKDDDVEAHSPIGNAPLDTAPLDT
jgi:hypothetical protein